MQTFLLVVNLVQKQPIDELVRRLKAGKLISKERVLRESMGSIVSVLGSMLMPCK